MLKVRLPEEDAELQGQAEEPEAVRRHPERGRGRETLRLLKAVAEGIQDRAYWEDVQVNQVRDVFERLVRDVGQGLGDGEGPQGAVLDRA